MTSKSPTRTSTRGADVRIPDDLKLGTVVLADLTHRGILAKVAEWLPLSRRAGHTTGSLFAFLVVFLQAGTAWGIRPFSLAFRKSLKECVAPLAGFCALPTAASLSRALGRLPHAAVRTFSDQLLLSEPASRALLAAPQVLHRDAHGHGWHVLDFDPTVEAFRQRDLPDEEALPSAVRLAPGHPGYTGHKRGELRIRHLLLQHAGAGLWMAYRLDASGGSLLPLLRDMLRVGRSLLEEVAPAPVLVRADGEFGSVGALRTCLDAGTHVLTRCSKYSLLEREDVIAAMAAAHWREVSASGGGPVRSAADLGRFTFYPDEHAHLASEGSVEVRVVVSRFSRTSPPNHGVLRDGFQLELFATSLLSDAWPAEEVVALYSGRSALENRFAQEDRELGLYRTFSYHPPGQECVAAIGLFLWNLWTSKGVLLAPLPAKQPPQALRKVSPVAEIQDIGLAHEVSVAPEPTRHSEDSSVTLPVSLTTEDERAARDERWSIALAALERHPVPDDWSVDAINQVLRGPNGEHLHATGSKCEMRRRANGSVRVKARIVFQVELVTFHVCSLHPPSEPPEAYRQLTRAIPESALHRLRELKKILDRKKNKDPAERRCGRPARPATTPRPDPSALPETPGPFVPAAPLFLPAASRKLARELLRSVTVEVHLRPRFKPRTPSHPLLASTATERQHRRHSWLQRTERWAFSGKTTLHLQSSPPLTKLMKRKLATSFAI